MTCPDNAVEFYDDAELGYARSRTNFKSCAGLEMDETYRLAHLPLVVSKRHSRVISHILGKDYDYGIHAQRIFSLVLPIEWKALAAVEGFQKMDAEARTSRFGSKISWDTVHKRRHKLHATICGSLSYGTAPAFDSAQERALRSVGPIRYELRGVFSGNVNVGRLYVKLYPQRRSNGNPLQKVQSILGTNVTDMYLVGIYNLVDDLTEVEADALRLFIEKWWNETLGLGTITHLNLIGTKDDLALDSNLVTRIPLV